MYGVWPSQYSYTQGEAPYMVGETTWDEALGSIQAETSVLKGHTSIFVATRVGDDWIPLSFVNAKTGTVRGINEKQSKKYLNKRDSNNPSNEPVLAEPEPQMDLSTNPPVETEGDLVLQVTPHVAELLRDAFTLIAAGRPVTIQTVQQPPQ